MAATVVGDNGKLVRNCYECSKCNGLYYCADPAKKDTIGSCAGGDRHGQGTTERKILDYGKGEGGWRFCKFCACVYFNSSATAGTCVGGGAHAPLDLELTIEKSTPDQAPSAGWGKCGKCACLFDRNAAGNGSCPKNAKHEAANTAVYTVYAVTANG
jgi:hypothetical protein